MQPICPIVSRRLAPLVALFLAAGCALPENTPVAHDYPVSGREARQSGNNYKTVSEANGSLIDAVPGAAKTAALPRDEATERAGRRVGWRVFGEEDAEMAKDDRPGAAGDPYHIASLGNPRLVVPPTLRGEEGELLPPGQGEDRRLWRGALDALSFMPITSADPTTGVIVTDWFTPQERENERFRVTVFVLAPVPAVENLRVMLQRQTRPTETAAWEEEVVTPQLLAALEQQILDQAGR